MEATPIERYYSEWDSPIGSINLVASNQALEIVLFKDDEKWKPIPDMYQFSKNIILEQTIIQLEEYFEGNRNKFELPLNQSGTNFQQQVWNTLNSIHFATTETYSQLAERLGDKNKTRAVATANAKNQLLIVVPCHRIIGENRKLVGYRGGLDRKRWLINFENENSSNNKINTLF